jgi:lipopolysaccharide transport system permease protein
VSSEPEAHSPQRQWSQRQLYALAYLTYYNLVQQYTRAMLGILWFLLSPILLVIVYGAVLTFVFRVPGGDSFAHALHVLAGLLAWVAFQEGVSSGALSILNNPTVVRSSPLPPIFLPTVKVLQAFLGLALATVLLVVAGSLVDRLQPARLVVLPFMVVTLLAFTLGVAWALSALAVFVRDVAQMLSTLFMVGFFATPVLYTPDMIQGLPRHLHLLLAWNPLTPFLGLARSCLVDAPLEVRDLVLAPVWAVAAVVVGLTCFRALEPGLGDAL